MLKSIDEYLTEDQDATQVGRLQGGDANMMIKSFMTRNNIGELADENLKGALMAAFTKAPEAMAQFLQGLIAMKGSDAGYMAGQTGKAAGIGATGGKDIWRQAMSGGRPAAIPASTA